MFSPSIKKTISENLNKKFSIQGNDLKISPIGGGSINKTYRLIYSDHTFFCKLNSATEHPNLFQKERNGLELIQKQAIIKVPEVIDCFEMDEHQVLILEWIQEGERTEKFWKLFGEQLAGLHQVSHNYFGLEEDNYMGSVAQNNHPTGNWIDFFILQRVTPLIQQCFNKKILDARQQNQFVQLFKKLEGIFEKEVTPSLLHGDLWSGNFMCNEEHEVVLIDPAVYFGHSSVDMGMTSLFGGFHSSFYESYAYHFQLPANYMEQWQVCNLYPLLIHLLLFGKSYLPRIESILNKFC